MSKKLSPAEMNWCIENAITDTVEAWDKNGFTAFDLYAAIVSHRSNADMIELEDRKSIQWQHHLRDVWRPSVREFLFCRCMTYQAAMRFAIETRRAKADA